MRFLILATALAATACGPATEAGGIPEYACQVVHTYPHDNTAYTQGLFYPTDFSMKAPG